jgi:tricarballylate dehydrogenase
VLVVGAGNAASVAALAAHDLGAKVVLLERAPKERRGGNSAFSGGLFRFAFPDFEQIKGIVKETAGAEFKNVEVEPYPKDRFYGDLMRVTEGLADPILTELLVERSQDVVTWMAQHGVIWELHMSHCARVRGKLVWRTGTIPVAAREGGKGLMEMHFATVEKRGLEVIYSARALELLVDQSGAIEGVLIASPAGRQKIMTKAMILACGGFEANPEMRARYLGRDWDLSGARHSL